MTNKELTWANFLVEAEKLGARVNSTRTVVAYTNLAFFENGNVCPFDKDSVKERKLCVMASQKTPQEMLDMIKFLQEGGEGIMQI